jgi:hypothetical protein
MQELNKLYNKLKAMYRFINRALKKKIQKYK